PPRTPFSPTPSLHDALPIWFQPAPTIAANGQSGQLKTRLRPTASEQDLQPTPQEPPRPSGERVGVRGRSLSTPASAGGVRRTPRSEEHTSELQSRENLVCRL